MSIGCNFINSNSSYRERRDDSGIDKLSFKKYAESFMDETGRLPHIEEVPGSNSLESIKENLHLDKNGYTSNKSIEEFTGQTERREQNKFLNNRFTDKEIEVKDVSPETARVIVTDRPKIFMEKVEDYKPFEPTINESILGFDSICNRISKLYGVNVHIISSSEIQSMGAYDALTTKGFVKDGEIFINRDLASLDTPVHELLHLIMGTVKAHDSETYNKLCDTVSTMYNLDEMSLEYPGRTRRDVQEELLVTETARFVVGLSSELDNAENSTMSEFVYLLNRSFDTIMNGSISVNNANLSEIMQSNSSISHLAGIFRSRLFNENTSYLIDKEAARLQRVNANKIENLIKQGILKEDCN